VGQCRTKNTARQPIDPGCQETFTFFYSLTCFVTDWGQICQKLNDMKKLILPFLILCNTVYGQITYVDNFDGVYPYPSSSSGNYNLDINNDQQNDIKLNLTYNPINYPDINCGSSTGDTYVNAYFNGINNSFGQNKVNGPVATNIVGIDCTGDTLNAFDLWNNNNNLYKGWYPTNQLCYNIGIGSHKQGFRLLLTNPANGSLGYKYGYIDYTITPSGDIVIHGWYYENTFNVPIVANSLLDYPYDGNCVHYDTVTVQDTIVTQVFDTITTTIYDTVTVTNYTTVTDTLIINASLGLPAPNNQNTILVYPNPASDHITIDNGNYISMAGYSIKIENSTGQQVFQSIINQPQFYVDLSSWTGNGLYYIHLIDPNNNTVTIRKIVLQ
jgi:hypothetical protein